MNRKSPFGERERERQIKRWVEVFVERSEHVLRTTHIRQKPNGHREDCVRREREREIVKHSSKKPKARLLALIRVCKRKKC